MSPQEINSLNNRKVLVTGGAGFIGSNLVADLVRSGNQVTVIDNFVSGYRSNLYPFPSVRLIEKDIMDRDAVLRAVEGNEIIFHLAASVGNKRSINDPVTDASVNVLGTLNILEVAKIQGVGRW